MTDTMDLTGRKQAVETAIQGGRSLWDDAKARLFRNKAAVVSMWVHRFCASMICDGRIAPANTTTAATKRGAALAMRCGHGLDCIFVPPELATATATAVGTS